MKIRFPKVIGTKINCQDWLWHILWHGDVHSPVLTLHKINLWPCRGLPLQFCEWTYTAVITERLQTFLIKVILGTTGAATCFLSFQFQREQWVPFQNRDQLCSPGSMQLTARDTNRTTFWFFHSTQEAICHFISGRGKMPWSISVEVQASCCELISPSNTNLELFVP